MNLIYHNKNKLLQANGDTTVSSGQIYYKGNDLETVVDSLSYVPLLLHHLLESNPSDIQIDSMENVLTKNLDEFVSPVELARIADGPGDAYNKISSLLNYIHGQYEWGPKRERIPKLSHLHHGMELPEFIDVELSSIILILNSLPKLFALIDHRTPYHDAETFIESFFINVLAKKQNKLPEKELIMWDSYLVSLFGHGLTSPSYHGFRSAANVWAPLTASLNGWLAAATGDLHFGALGGSMRDLVTVRKKNINHSSQIKSILDKSERVFGYGHRVHPRLIANFPHKENSIEQHQEIPYDISIQSDPRVRINFHLWEKLHYDGFYTKAALDRSKEAFLLVGCANVDAMAAGLYLDLGLTEHHSLLGPFIARIPHLLAIYLQETGKTQRVDIKPNQYINLEKR